MAPTKRIEEWRVTSASAIALQMSGALDPSHVTATADLPRESDHILDISEIQHTAVVDDRCLPKQIVEAFQQPLPESPTSSGRSSRKSSLEILLQCQDHITDSQNISLPSSGSSNRSDEQLSQEGVVDNPKSSLEVLLSSRAQIEKTTFDASSVPLPSSSTEHSYSEASSLRIL